MEVLHELEDMIDAELIETLWNVNATPTYNEWSVVWN